MEESKETVASQEKKPVRIENDTKFTRESLKKFYKHMKVLGVIFIVLGIALILPAFIEIFRSDEDTFDTLMTGGVVVVGCGIALLAMYKMTVKNNKVVTNDTHTLYRFYDDEWTANDFDGKNKRGESHLFYNQIVKVKKRGDYYQLFIGAVAVLVDKTSFTIGAEEDFKAFLKEKCDKKAIKFK